MKHSIFFLFGHPSLLAMPGAKAVFTYSDQINFVYELYYFENIT